jgi:hypothetical protein
VQRSRGLAEVPKIEKSSIVEEETGGRRSRGSGVELRRFAERKQRIFAKSRRAISIQTIGSGGTWQRSTHFRGGTLREKSRGEIPEELGSEVILVHPSR